MSADRTLDLLATQIGLPAQLVRDLFENGLISLDEAQREADLRELRRARRLSDELELQHAAITIILRLRQRALTLQHELTELRRSTRAPSNTLPAGAWSEAEWIILDEDQ